MKKIAGLSVLLILMLLVSVPGFATETMAESVGRPEWIRENWELTFLDDFEGDSIDYTKWVHRPEWQRGEGFWSDEDAFVDGDGHLIIRTREEDGQYYTGAIGTQRFANSSEVLFTQKFGYFEMRAKLPKNLTGFHVAFWLMPEMIEEEVFGTGEDWTEIDIFEAPFNREVVFHALHWDGYDEHHRSASQQVFAPGLFDGFQTFALEWTEDEYIFYVNDQETWRTSAGGVSKAPSHMIISSEAKNWGGNINHNRDLPQDFVVDYVRVYQDPAHLER